MKTGGCPCLGDLALSSARKFSDSQSAATLIASAVQTSCTFHDWSHTHTSEYHIKYLPNSYPVSCQPLAGWEGHRHASGSRFHRKPLSSTMIQQDQIPQFTAFHDAHFPGQPIPKLIQTPQPVEDVTQPAQPVPSAHEDLGYYEDGVKRTLTEDQIKLFRHSEIQRLLSERRAARDRDITRKIKKDRGTSSPGTRESRKRQFYDEPARAQPDVDVLMYDDPPESHSASSPAKKKFLWPILGQQPT